MSTTALDGPCGPWLSVDEAQQFAAWPAGTPEEEIGTAVAWATDLLYRLGQPFVGTCTDTIRPVRCGCRIPDGCNARRLVQLPLRPVIDVLEILVDGAALDPGAYRLVDRIALVRTDGNPWPCSQRLDLPTTDEGTWSIRYRWGQVAPLSGRHAAAILGLELWRSTHPGEGECRLPKRITSLTREGVTMAILDPMDLLDGGKTGIVEVDLFLSAYPRNVGSGRLIDPLLARQHNR